MAGWPLDARCARMSLERSNKTESELLFERYLAENGLADWLYEPPNLAGQIKRPDYLVQFNDDTGEVFGAMLGDLGFTRNVHLSGDSEIRPGEHENVFLGGGKMLRPGRYAPQNTTISSIVVIETLKAFDPDVYRVGREAVKHEAQRLGRELSLCETVNFRASSDPGKSLWSP